MKSTATGRGRLVALLVAGIGAVGGTAALAARGPSIAALGVQPAATITAAGGVVSTIPAIPADKAQADRDHAAWVAARSSTSPAPKPPPAGRAATSCPVALPPAVVHAPEVAAPLEGLVARQTAGTTGFNGVAYYFDSGADAGDPSQGAVFVLTQGPDPCQGQTSRVTRVLVPGHHGPVTVLSVNGPVLTFRSADGTAGTLDLTSGRLRLT